MSSFIMSDWRKAQPKETMFHVTWPHDDSIVSWQLQEIDFKQYFMRFEQAI